MRYRVVALACAVFVACWYCASLEWRGAVSMNEHGYTAAADAFGLNERISDARTVAPSRAQDPPGLLLGYAAANGQPKTATKDLKKQPTPPVTTHVMRLHSSAILLGLCAVTTLNCSASARPLVMSALRHVSPPQGDVVSGGYSSSPEQPLKAHIVMETGQRMKVLLPPVANEQPSVASHTFERMCHTGVHVAHFMVGRYHSNLMHTMMRVLSIQRAVLELQRDVIAACSGRSVAVRLLVVPRHPPTASSTSIIGFYEALVPLLAHVAQWHVWPSDASLVCGGSSENATVSCKSFVSFQHDYVQFYEPKNAHPFTKESLRLVRQNAIAQWQLADAADSGDALFTVLIINRRLSRRVKNVQDMIDAYQLLANATNLRAPVRFEVVELEDLAVMVQARVFARAHLVVAVHGAALAWSLFMRPGSSLLELVPPGWAFLRRDHSMFQVLSDAASVREHIMLFLRQRSGSVLNDPFSRNFTLHGKDILKIASWIKHSVDRSYTEGRA